MSVDCWFACTELLVVWPLEAPGWVLTPTPGLMFAPALTSLFAMPTFAPTPTFGFTLVEDPEPLPVPPALALPLPDVVDWLCCVPWFMVEDEFTSVEL